MSAEPAAATPQPALRTLAQPDELVERLPVAVALVDAQGRVSWANARFLELFDAGALAGSGLLEGCAPAGRVTLQGRRGPVEVLAHCLRAAELRMLVLDDTPGELETRAVRTLKERLERLEREAMVDPLTGAWNRRYLDHAMEVELGRARRYRQPLAAAMLDIDHFKRVNDSFGHAAGDEVLRELTQLARDAMRATDALVRWGGEEFLLLMPYSSHRAAAAAAEKLRAAIAQHDFTGVGRVTASFGAGELLAGEEPPAFFARLDAALYRAKGAGRNRVVADARGASEQWDASGPGGMVRLVWQAEYACGEPTIDAEHEELFRLANELIDAGLRQAQEPAAFLAALTRCLGHVARHFADEERILEARGYAELARHRAEHRMLLERAGALEAAAERGEVTAGTLVDFFAGEVVARHLLAADRQFFPLFASAGTGGG